MDNTEKSLKGKLLVAMPNMVDPRFHKTVIFMCSHTDEGAMGLVINQPFPMTMGELFDQLDCDAPQDKKNIQVLSGGPVDTQRGFLLHTTDYSSPETINVNDRFSVTATVEALTSFASGNGPRDTLFTLGYAGWGPGQLEEELLGNSWLIVDASYELLYNTEIASRWERALLRHGIDPVRLSGAAGHA